MKFVPEYVKKEIYKIVLENEIFSQVVLIRKKSITE